MKVVAYYTLHTGYADYVDDFIDNLSDYGLQAEIYRIRNLGSWEENCAMKPQVLMWALEDFPEEDLLYLDIDAVVKREPDYTGFKSIPGIAKFRGRVQSGTIYLPVGNERERLVSTWLGMQKVRGKVWDQIVLEEVLKKTDIPHFTLPPAWIAIDKIHRVQNPIIYHTQASRKLKKIINKGNSA